ncbi:hypothetical protein [Rahnella sp. CJA17(1/100)]|uniref:hypothetical protein n=1 Tax=Rahnella sp. CJA17(1/100) TaxID=2508951 RepID=UPI00106FE730|nr:hypothetical protein [Rahnella sp. CJA17(1/100)]
MNNNEALLDDMYRLRSFLDRYGICQDTGPINRLIVKLNANKQGEHAEAFEYSLDDLVFHIEEKNGTICPPQITPKSSPIEIHLELILKSNGVYNFINIKEMSGQLRLVAEWLNDASDDGEIKTSHTAWHFDFHVPESNDGTNLFCHPRFHIQNGGNRLTDSLQNYGDLMIMDAPRLPLPPMDVVLAIDFILSNFFGSVWQEALCDSEYRDVVSRAQERWWRPYYEGIYQHWTNREQKLSVALLPNLI